jgi:uncharacterized membrane protein
MISAGQSMPPQGPTPGQGGQTSGLAPNIAGLLCYICPPITGIIFLLIEKDNRDVKFHAWQSLAFGVCYVVVLIALEILAALMGVIASVLGIIVGFFVPILILAAFIVWIICMIKAYQGERWRIPVIGDFAAKKAGLE